MDSGAKSGETLGRCVEQVRSLLGAEGPIRTSSQAREVAVADAKALGCLDAEQGVLLPAVGIGIAGIEGVGADGVTRAGGVGARAAILTGVGRRALYFSIAVGTRVSQGTGCHTEHKGQCGKERQSVKKRHKHADATWLPTRKGPGCSSVR